MRVEQGFQPPAFAEGHPYQDDPVLPSILQRLCPPEYLERIEPDLVRFGNVISSTIRETANLATPPYLIQYDQWGRRVDKLVTSESWRTLKRISQREGIPGIFYEREFGDFSRTYGFLKILLMVGDSQVIGCPLSMTDGCARVIELYGTPQLKRDILPRLVSRDPDLAFTSGQWMTERPGGSDVSQTETTASSDEAVTDFGPLYTLDGFKWFSSATDSDVSLALARTGPLSQGSRSLSLFLVPLRLPLFHDRDARPSSTSNGILVHRLKNKFGTQIVPTAELSLNSTKAYRVGELNQGVKQISSVLNITRIHSGIGSVGYVRRAFDIARSFAKVRQIDTLTGPMFLKDNALHLAELSKIALTYRALVNLTLGVVGLLGQVECGTDDKDVQDRLRLLTPIVKGFCAEKGVHAVIQCMVALGGQGYMEENSLGRLIRDGLVEQSWEGTTTVLALDVMRAVQKTQSLHAFVQWATKVIAACPASLQIRIANTIEALKSSIQVLIETLTPPVHPLCPRPVFFLLGYLSSALYLLEHAIWSEAADDADVVVKWVEDGLLKAVEDVNRTKIIRADEAKQLNARLVYGIPTKL